MAIISNACERCGNTAYPAAQIAPLGDQPGKRIFHCSACDHFTWVDWHGSFGSQPPQEAGSKSAAGRGGGRG